MLTQEEPLLCTGVLPALAEGSSLLQAPVWPALPLGSLFLRHRLMSAMLPAVVSP